MADINAIADQIQGLTLLEASQLVKMLEEKLGVSAAAAAPIPPRRIAAANNFRKTFIGFPWVAIEATAICWYQVTAPEPTAPGS